MPRRQARKVISRKKQVFINCPFHKGFQPLFEAMIFTILDCGLVPRCALEEDNAANDRFNKICMLIAECDFAIHDLSYVDLDPKIRLPRFNMPFELGLYLGCCEFGSGGSRKSCLILDKDKFRYRKFISDLSGKDIRAHGGKPERVIKEVRDWLVTAAKIFDAPDGGRIWRRYKTFRKALPKICGKIGKVADRLLFVEFVQVVKEWRRAVGDLNPYAPPNL